MVGTQLGTVHHEGAASAPALPSTQRGRQLPSSQAHTGADYWYLLFVVESDLFDDLAVNFIVQILLLLAQLHSERREHQRGEESIREASGHLCALSLPAPELCQKIADSQCNLKLGHDNLWSVVLYRLQEAGRLCSHPGSQAQGKLLHAQTPTNPRPYF